ncbi:hypothetical protein CRUP_037509 [Coryphaenoides rupestris]|nr:hypothetical protein CRUP_037509 [Coryphaenoides rupestris]
MQKERGAFWRGWWWWGVRLNAPGSSRLNPETETEEMERGERHAHGRTTEPADMGGGRRRLRWILLLLFALSVQPQAVCAVGTFELQIRHFQNAQGLLHTGECCDLQASGGQHCSARTSVTPSSGPASRSTGCASTRSARARLGLAARGSWAATLKRCAIMDTKEEVVVEEEEEEEEEDQKGLMDTL